MENKNIFIVTYLPVRLFDFARLFMTEIPKTWTESQDVHEHR